MEQFNDTPIVNGVAYPEVTLQPKTYRFRVLNAANDRFFNFQWYVADPSTGTLSEVALDPLLLQQAQTDPVVFPTPVHNASTDGPDWVQIGSEGGFLPTPTVVNGQQETTWITDPTRFDVGNVDLHSLLLAPAERADVIVDFSKFAGKTLILYNDAPAAFPARVPTYDYYTGAPDLSPNGAPAILPGYGPNTRTIMRVTIAAAAPAPAFNLNKLNTAFAHKTDGSGVFESSQHPIIVGQAAYNKALGTSFAANSNCNPIPNDPNPAFQICDGLVRVNDTMTFGFNTLKKPITKTTLPLQPKAIHDEMNSTTFDEFGRMQANLGVEAQPPTPGVQNGTFYPYVNPQTELLNGTNLPKNMVTYDTAGNPVSDVKITPMTDATDGTQIWRVTHNGVDTHPIHFHLYDVQMLNRVTWDNIVIPIEPSELGWKETVRIAPLEDTIVALRPIVPQLPWEVPNAIHNLNPMDPTGSTKLFNNVDVQGNPTAPIVNQLVNYGWEYVWHCHILSHEEMDMMRPQTLALPPVTPDGLTFVINQAGNLELTFTDNSITETAFVVQRNDGTGWVDAGTILSPLDQTNTHGLPTFTDTIPYDPTIVYSYRVAAQNTVGYVADPAFPQMTVQSVSAEMLTGPAPAAPSGLTGIIANSIDLTWTDNAADETGFTVQRAVNGGAWANLATVGPNTAANSAVVGPVNYVDTTVTPGNTYIYRVRADSGAAASAWSNTFTIAIPAVPAAPSGLTATLVTPTSGRLDFTDNAAGETGFTIQRNENGAGWVNFATLPANPGTGAVAYTDTTVTPGNTYDYQVRAETGTPIVSGWSNTATLVVPAVPNAPTLLTATAQAGPQVALSFTDNATNETGFTIERADNGGAWAFLTTLAADTTTFSDTTVVNGHTYDYRVRADNGLIVSSTWSNTATASIVAAPTNIAGVVQGTPNGPQVRVTWTDNATNETAFTLQRSSDGGTMFTTLTLLAADTTTYIDPAPAAPGGYVYRVNAFNPNGTSAWNTSATVTVPTIPAAPAGISGTVNAGPSITLTWTDNATTESGFTLERAVVGGGFATISSTLPANTTGYVDTTVALGTNYSYRVRADNVTGSSAWNTSAGIYVPTLPAAPTNLARTVARTAAGPDSVSLTWVDNANNPNYETGFTLQRATNNTFTANVTNITVAANATAYTDSVTHGQTWYYRIQAVNVVGLSAWSNTVSATTVPLTPTNFRATNIGRTALTLNWNDVSANETGYQLQRRRVGANNWTTVVTTAANATSYRDTNRSPNTQYDYRIRGVNGVGNSPWVTIRVRTLP